MPNEIPVLLKLTAEKTASVNAVLESTEAGFKGIAGSLVEFGATASKVAAGAALALGGLVGGALKVAGEFEQLQAKLTTVLGDAARATQTFREAQITAASTPFDVKGVIDAIGIIESFGQSSQRVFPLAANLAAGMGTNLQETALDIGKAFSGSLTGFKALRDTFGITTLELQKAGAEVTGLGGVSVNTASKLDKARNALTQIINTRFGDAVARQAATLFGAFSNLGDVVQRLAAAFGGGLVPLFTGLARTLTALLEVVEAVPRPILTLVSSTALIGAGVAAASAAVLALSTVMVRSTATLIAFSGALAGVGRTSVAAAGQMAVASRLVDQFGRPFSAAGVAAQAAVGPVQAAGAAGTAAAAGLTRLGQGFSAAAVAARAFLLTPFGAALAVAGTAMAALAVSTSVMTHATELADQAVQAQSRALTKAANDFRFYQQKLEQATGAQVQFVRGALDTRDVAEKTAAALSKLTPSQAVEQLTKLGLTVDGLSKDLQKNRQDADSSLKVYQSLQRAAQSFEQLQGSSAINRTGGTIGALLKSGDLKAVQEATGKLVPTYEDVTRALKTYQDQHQAFGGAAEIVKQYLAQFEKLNPVLDEATKGAQTFGVFLKEATKPDDVAILQRVMGQLDGKIAETEGKLAKVGLPAGNIEALQQKLLTGTEEEREAVKAMLDLYEDRERLVKRTASIEEKAVKDRIKAEEDAIARESLLKGENHQREINRLRELAKTLKEGSDEQFQVLKKASDKERELGNRRVQLTRDSLGQAAQSARNSVEDLRGSGTATAQEVANALQAVVVKLQAWAKANRTILDQNPDLRREYTGTLQGFTKEMDKAKTDVPRQRLQGILDDTKKSTEEAVTNTQKLAAVQASLGLLKLTADSGEINTLATKRTLQNEVNRLRGEELRLQKEVTKEQHQQAAETNALIRETHDQQIEILKAQQETEGKDNTFLIRQAKERQVKEALDAIHEQEQAEIDSGVSVEVARQRTEERITQFKQAETLRRMEAEKQAANEAVKIEQDKRARLEGLKQSRFGGAASPLQSIEEMALESTLGSTNIPGFRQRSALQTSSPFPSVPRTVGQIQAQIDTDLRAGEAQRQKAGAGKAEGQLMTSETNIVNINGADLGADKNDVADFVTKMKRRAKAKGLIAPGPAAPQGVQ